MKEQQHGFAAVLVSAAASPVIASDDLFGRLVGSWKVTAVDYAPPGGRSEVRGEWHFARVLEGRAIQDVWIAPEKKRRTQDLPEEGNRYGSSFRMYDAASRGWRLWWFNPVNGETDSLAARAAGDDIIQEGTRPDGTHIRWCFRDIRPRSFHWTGEKSVDGGRSWTMENEFFATR
jgi:hypothetical protein